MALRVAINGFGRIGRLVLRAIVESGRRDIEIVAVNDLGPIETNAHLLRYDSVHGRFPGTVTVDGDTMIAAGHRIKVTCIKNPAELPHKELDVDIALECTGIFTTKEKASAHLTAGAKRVLVSAPCDAADVTVVYGVNHDKLTKNDLVVSNASCTTNCLVPVAKVLNDAVGIERGMMTTIHSYTKRPADAGPDAQGSLSRPRRRAFHDPHLDRRGQGHGPGAARTQGQAGRYFGARAHAQCLAGGSEIHCQAADQRGRDKQRHQGRGALGPLKGILEVGA